MQYTITDAGIAAVENYELGGPKIEITEFKVGDAVNYSPSSSDTALHGTILHTGVPSNYFVQGDDVVVWSLIMDDNVGDFNFGEIGLYLGDGTLFALAALPALQLKRQSTVNAAGNTIEMLAKVQFTRVVPSIDFTTITGTTSTLVEVNSLSDLTPPSAAPANIQRSLSEDEYGRSIVVIEDDDSRWVSYNHDNVVVAGATVSSGTVTSVTATGLGDMLIPFKTGRYLVQFLTGALAGRVREISAISGDQLTWTNSVGTAPSAGDTFEVLRASSFTDFNRYVTEYNLLKSPIHFFNLNN